MVHQAEILQDLVQAFSHGTVIKYDALSDQVDKTFLYEIIAKF